MTVTVKKVILWRKDLENSPGTLAQTLKPFAAGRVNLQIVMGYNYPGNDKRSAVEIFPVVGKGQAAAKSVKLQESKSTHCLLVEGDDRAGLAHDIAQGLADAGINISFVMMQMVSRRYQGVFGFKQKNDLQKASRVIKAVCKSKTKTKAKKSSGSKKVARKSKKTSR